MYNYKFIKLFFIDLYIYIFINLSFYTAVEAAAAAAAAAAVPQLARLAAPRTGPTRRWLGQLGGVAVAAGAATVVCYS